MTFSSNWAIRAFYAAQDAPGAWQLKNHSRGIAASFVACQALQALATGLGFAILLSFVRSVLNVHPIDIEVLAESHKQRADDDLCTRACACPLLKFSQN
jgi:hypothetical protein